MDGGRMYSIVASRSWRDGRVVDDDVLLEEIPDAVRQPEGVVWIDLLRPTVADMDALAAELSIPATSVEDALAPLERPKIVRHETHEFFTVYSTWLAPLADVKDGEGRLRTARISGIVLPTALVTIHLDDNFDIAPVLALWEENAELLKYGSGALLHGLLDVVVDGHFEAIQQLDDVVDTLEEQLFEKGRTGPEFSRNVFLLRKDMVSSLFETNLSLQDAHLNTIMKKLAAWAAIIAVPTAITGWFGQNVPYPGFAASSGMWMSASAIVGMSALLYVVFRKQDWL